MPIEMRVVRNRKSPGGVITCQNGHLMSRKKFNNQLRFKKTPKCSECGDEALTADSPFEIRSGRLIWTPRRKMIKKLVMGKSESDGGKR